MRPQLEIGNGHEAARFQVDRIKFDQLLDTFADAGSDVQPTLLAQAGIPAA